MIKSEINWFNHWLLRFSVWQECNYIDFIFNLIQLFLYIFYLQAGVYIRWLHQMAVFLSMFVGLLRMPFAAKRNMQNAPVWLLSMLFFFSSSFKFSKKLWRNFFWIVSKGHSISKENIFICIYIYIYIYI